MANQDLSALVCAGSPSPYQNGAILRPQRCPERDRSTAGFGN